MTMLNFLLFLPLLLALFLGPKSVDAESNSKTGHFTDAEFEKQLSEKTYVRAPIYLGCNRQMGKEPKFPVHCFYENLQVLIEEDIANTLNWNLIFDSIVETHWWEKYGQEKGVSFINWSTDPVSYLVVKETSASTVCVHGRKSVNAQQAVDALQFIDCYKIFSDRRGEQRVIHVSFEDLGFLQVFGENQRRSDFEFQVFATFFVSRIF